MKAINEQEYQVSYDPETATVVCAGTFRIQGEEYDPILALMNEAVEDRPPLLTLNLQGLEFLNSSGINTISRFVMQVRKENASKLVVKGSDSYPWQRKSLKNLERLLPGLELEW